MNSIVELTDFFNQKLLNFVIIITGDIESFGHRDDMFKVVFQKKLKMQIYSYCTDEKTLQR